MASLSCFLKLSEISYLKLLPHPQDQQRQSIHAYMHSKSTTRCRQPSAWPEISPPSVRGPITPLSTFSLQLAAACPKILQNTTYSRWSLMTCCSRCAAVLVTTFCRNRRQYIFHSGFDTVRSSHLFQLLFPHIGFIAGISMRSTSNDDTNCLLLPVKSN